MTNILPREIYPAINALVDLIDEYFAERHPNYFGRSPRHPVLKVKRAKVIHDNLWGTNNFTWPELAIIDSPFFQRLRYIHQTGLAYQVYPSAHHTRFEHSLGVATVASRIFDSIVRQQRGLICDIVETVIRRNPDDGPSKNAATEQTVNDTIAQWRLELRLAGLLHDTGHSLFSHTSELVFSSLGVVERATHELALLAGKAKGAGESIAFAITISESMQQLLKRCGDKLLGSDGIDEYVGPIDLLNVALMIIGRSRHSYLQFLGDVISSGFDADKLDYLLRDAQAAGLPLQYDFERYIFAVRIEKGPIADGEGHLEKLYALAKSGTPDRRQPTVDVPYTHFESYRLRLPTKAMNTIEQIVICKLMLFSYIYHHPKVRAAEGALVELLHFVVDGWRAKKKSDEEIFMKFLTMADSSLQITSELTDGLDVADAEHISTTAYNITNRLLPREVYGICGAVAYGAERLPLKDFLTSLQDKTDGPRLRKSLELEIGQQLISARAIDVRKASDAVRHAGIRIDVPNPPKFEDVNELVVKGSQGAPDIQLLQVFPIGQWTQAYTAFRYYVRIFCYSEYVTATESAAKIAMKKVIGIQSDEFYRKIMRKRE